MALLQTLCCFCETHSIAVFCTLRNLTAHFNEIHQHLLERPAVFHCLDDSMCNYSNLGIALAMIVLHYGRAKRWWGNGNKLQSSLLHDQQPLVLIFEESFEDQRSKSLQYPEHEGILIIRSLSPYQRFLLLKYFQNFELSRRNTVSSCHITLLVKKGLERKITSVSSTVLHM